MTAITPTYHDRAPRHVIRVLHLPCGFVPQLFDRPWNWPASDVWLQYQPGVPGTFTTEAQAVQAADAVIAGMGEGRP